LSFRLNSAPSCKKGWQSRMIEGFYFITGSELSRAGNLSDVKSAVAAGVKVVQYRNKHASTKEMYQEALKLKLICKGITFLINDRVDIAQAVGANGVHLGGSDLPYKIARKLLGKSKIIGLTVHSLTEAIIAQRLGANYISVGPIFATKTKSNALAPRGVGLIKEIKKHVCLPIVAIGGINLSNAKDIIQAGADGLCAISAVVTKPGVGREIEKFQALFYGR